MQRIPSENLSIDRKDRVNTPTKPLEFRSPDIRIHDFNEVFVQFNQQRAIEEASRCIHCPDPAICTLACPAHNDIPSAMWLIEQGKFIEAASIYRQHSSLPEICARVCPHTELCAGSCVLGKDGTPVRTGELEAFVIDYVRKQQGVTIAREKATGKKVAIIGSGPSGLACAEQLAMMGHDVTIYEAKPHAGGLLLYGIPNFKLSKDVIFARLKDLEDAGIKIINNVKVGKDTTIDDLFTQGFQAVYIGVGANVDTTMGVPGEDLPGVMRATEFLIRANVDPKLLPAEFSQPLLLDKRLVVVGGGDTASDCLRAGLRLGVDEVICVYRRTEAEMPGSPKDRKLAKEEGAKYRFLTQPIKFIGDDNGQLCAIECIEMELGEPDEKGRRRPIPKEGTNFIIETRTAVLALGYNADPLIAQSTPKLNVNKWGLIITDPETCATSRDGVFAGGDAVTGPDLVVTAMMAGRKAALAINMYLTDKISDI